ncbi:hypothetical protein D3C73_1446170 [compost metagenome]
MDEKYSTTNPIFALCGNRVRCFKCPETHSRGCPDAGSPPARESGPAYIEYILEFLGKRNRSHVNGRFGAVVGQQIESGELVAWIAVVG